MTYSISNFGNTVQCFHYHPNPIERNSSYSSVRHVFYPPPFTCNKTRLECPKGVKDEVKQARRAKRVAEGHQLEIRAQRAPRFLVFYILYFIFSIEYWILSITKKIVIKFTILILRLDPLNQIYKQQHLNVNEMVGYRVPFDNMILVIDFSCFVL